MGAMARAIGQPVGGHGRDGMTSPPRRAGVIPAPTVWRDPSGQGPGPRDSTRARLACRWSVEMSENAEPLVLELLPKREGFGEHRLRSAGWKCISRPELICSLRGCDL